MIVRDQVLETATTFSGLDDFGDVPFLEPLDVLIDSFTPRCAGRGCGGGARGRDAHRRAGEAPASRRRPKALPGDRRRGDHRTDRSSSVSRARARPICTRSSRVSRVSGHRCSGRCRPRHRRPSAQPSTPIRASPRSRPRSSAARRDAGAPPDVGDPAGAVQPAVRLDVHQPGVDGVVRHPLVPATGSSMPTTRLPTRAPPHAAALAVAQSRPVGAQVPEAPALPRRVARPVPGRGADLDASRSGRRAAVRGEPHRLHARVQHP